MNILNFSYFLIIVYSIVFLIFNKNKRKILLLFFVGVQLILLFALRDISIGVDLVRYERTFEWIGNNSLRDAIMVRENYENIAYFLLNYLVSKLGFSYQCFLGIVGIISVVPLFYIIYLYSNSPCLSILIYLSFGVYAFQFSGLKQTIAMSIVLLAFIFLKNKKKKLFYFMILLAILFHPTAIIALPLYWILTTLKVKRMLTILSGGILIAFIFRNQLGFLLTYIYDSDYLGRYESSGSIGTMALLLLILVIAYLFLFQQKIAYPQYEESQYFRILLMCTMIQFLSSYAYAFTRLNYYFIQFLPLIVDQIVSLPSKLVVNGKEKYIFSKLGWITFFIICYFIYQNSVINGTNTYNYQFFFY